MLSYKKTNLRRIMISDIINPYGDTSKYIYHYTSVETLIKYILPQKQLMFSPLFKSNDPAELKWNICASIDDDGLLSDKFKAAMDDGIIIEKFISESITNNVKTICFSQDNPLSDYALQDYPISYYSEYYAGKGFGKPRMWAQYAVNHTGVCLVFEKEKFLDRFEKDYNNLLHFSDNVFYEKKISLSEEDSLYRTLLSSELDNKSLEEVAIERVKKYHKTYYFYKHEDWQTENEFRLVIKPDNNEDYYINVDGLLEHIILGARFDMKIVESLKILSSNFENKPRISPFYFTLDRYVVDEPIF